MRFVSEKLILEKKTWQEEGWWCEHVKVQHGEGGSCITTSRSRKWWTIKPFKVPGWKWKEWRMRMPVIGAKVIITWLRPQQQQITSSEGKTGFDETLYGREQTAQGHRQRFQKKPGCNFRQRSRESREKELCDFDLINTGDLLRKGCWKALFYNHDHESVLGEVRQKM